MNHSTVNLMTFEAANAFWAVWRNQDVQAAGFGDQFQIAEQHILSHQARTLDEADLQLTVVIDAMIGGGRSDGLDIDVVRRVQALIREVGRLVASPATLAGTNTDPGRAHKQ
jgi:hypothetical protein